MVDGRVRDLAQLSELGDMPVCYWFIFEERHLP